ncbi:MAG: hypothetical protein WC091_23110 [Sulfuricellaceae bacterium]
MRQQVLALRDQALSAPARNAADLLPKPLELAKQIDYDDIIAVIREGRGSSHASPF